MHRLLSIAVLLALLPFLTGATLIVRGPVRSGAITYDTDAQAFFDRVVTNGGTISTATKGYVNTFVLAAKANGYWSDIQRINLFCGDQLAACLTPLKINGAETSDNNVNFVSGDYTEATGLAGNGTSKRLYTDLTGNANGDANGHLCAVVATESGSTGVWLGANTTDLSGSNRNAIFGDSGTTLRYDYTGDTNNVSVTSDMLGIIVGSRVSGSDSRLFRNGSQVGSTQTSNGSGVTSRNFEVFSMGDALWFGGTLRGYSIGTGMTAAEVASFTTDLEAFNDSLGRGVIP